ncbi:MAG: 3-deoxy-manno-octulosonate cytidylyltransferase [Kiritimatiellae bacterium]|nr:3-deoxy-manno-octulosonate cytidylyltransferase [Kiritimatiellia bacterium]MDD4736245.1 3-deoxy-manno-octulosonate cytidylyltransferase [Kiritimatiellia bacterium]
MRRIIGVIPARWGSTRFPGKSLALIAGKPLIQRVCERCRQADRLSEVLVATDDERIADAARAIGVRSVMTRSDHPSGTDRIAEAVQGLDADVVINIQGDEPLISPALINRLGDVFDVSAWDMATAASPITAAQEVLSPAVVKVVTDQMGGALYFSRAPIPYGRDDSLTDPVPRGRYWRHIGIYAYRRSFLERLVLEPPCALEYTEKLEQLRALYLGARIRVEQVDEPGLGVDEPGDVARVEKAICMAGLE